MTEDLDVPSGARIWISPYGGYWAPVHGEVSIPKNWELLKTGDAGLTRAVRKVGPYWEVVEKARQFTKVIGTLAPAQLIEKVRTERAACAEELETKRAASAKSRKRKELLKSGKLRAEIIKYLEFRSEFEKEAQEIAESVVSWTTPVGSGTVGRSQSLSPAEIAERAVRAHLRHEMTNYDQRLDELRQLGILDDDSRDGAKRDAAKDVDAWLAERRRATHGLQDPR
ncbi:MAG: DUF2293 domain-containing protein [Candidatus Marsarchaeota archaeon]|nr:DUF2293 domain-containing protein [Candidatus Marsarchaeota archaeon]